MTFILTKVIFQHNIFTFTEVWILGTFPNPMFLWLIQLSIKLISDWGFQGKDLVLLNTKWLFAKVENWVHLVFLCKFHGLSNCEKSSSWGAFCL